MDHDLIINSGINWKMRLPEGRFLVSEWRTLFSPVVSPYKRSSSHYIRVQMLLWMYVGDTSRSPLLLRAWWCKLILMHEMIRYYSIIGVFNFTLHFVIFPSLLRQQIIRQVRHDTTIELCIILKHVNVVSNPADCKVFAPCLLKSQLTRQIQPTPTSLSPCSLQ